MAIMQVAVLAILCLTVGLSHTVSSNVPNFPQKYPNPGPKSRDFQLSNQIDAFLFRFEATIHRVDSSERCDFVKQVYQQQLNDVIKEIEKTVPESKEVKLEAIGHFLRFAVTFLEHHFLFCSANKEAAFEKADVECETNAYPPNPVFDLPWHKLDLGIQANHRWDDIAEMYKDEITAILDQVVHLISLIDPSGKLVKIVDDYMPLLLQKFPHQYRDEVVGIADTTGLSLGRIITFNIFYEIFSVCTSIVAENKNSGEHFHVRNLDFGLFLGWDFVNHTWKVSEMLRRMEFNLEVVNGSEPLFNQTTFAGYIGVFTGVKASRYSISVNERFVFGGGGGPAGLYDWIVKNEDLYFATWLVRDVLETNYDYDGAVNELSTRGLIAPCYFIVSGTEHNQGHLITRGRNESLQPLQLDLENDRWYLLETNYDHWKKPPFFDNRRTPGQHCMNESSAETIDKAHMFNVLSTDPNLNQLTVFSALMNPQTGEVEGYRRNCTSCFIW